MVFREQSVAQEGEGATFRCVRAICSEDLTASIDDALRLAAPARHVLQIRIRISLFHLEQKVAWGTAAPCYSQREACRQNLFHLEQKVAGGDAAWVGYIALSICIAYRVTRSQPSLPGLLSN